MTLADQLEPRTVSPDRLFLDPNNPRLVGAAPGDMESGVPDSVAEDDQVQAGLVARLKREIGIDTLVEKIRANGFLPIDRIVVRPSNESDDKFIVLEGNRRLASLKTILGEPISLAELSESVRSTFDEIDVLVYHGDDPMIAWSIQGLRHIEGVKEWGPFQRAAFLASLAERHDMTVPQIARIAGLRPNISNRLVRAYQGLRQSQQDPDWGQDIGEQDFAVFHEAVFARIQSELWKWLDWDDTAGEFKNEENLSTLLELVKDDSGPNGQPVIPRVNPDLRDHFQKVLAEPDRDRYIERLRSGDTTLTKIVNQIKEHDIRDDLADVEHAITRLDDLSGAVEILPMPRIVAADRGGRVLEALRAIQTAVQVQIDALRGALDGEPASETDE